MILTAEQQAAVEAIEGAIGKRELFALHGLAGTGKTTVAAYVAARWPGARLCALTGKAASVLRAKTGLPATTVHAAFYDFVRRDAGEGLVFAPAWSPGSLPTSRSDKYSGRRCSRRLCGRRMRFGRAGRMKGMVMGSASAAG